MPPGPNLAWSPKGDRLAVADDNGPINVWDVEAHRIRLTLPGRQGPLWLAWNPNSERLAASCAGSGRRRANSDRYHYCLGYEYGTGTDFSAAARSPRADRLERGRLAADDLGGVPLHGRHGDLGRDAAPLSGALLAPSDSATREFDPERRLFAVLTDNSLWEYSPLFTGTHWQMLSPGGTVLSIDAITDAGGADDVYAITADRNAGRGGVRRQQRPGRRRARRS